MKNFTQIMYIVGVLILVILLFPAVVNGYNAAERASNHHAWWVIHKSLNAVEHGHICNPSCPSEPPK